MDSPLPLHSYRVRAASWPSRPRSTTARKRGDAHRRVRLRGPPPICSTGAAVRARAPRRLPQDLPLYAVARRRATPATLTHCAAHGCATPSADVGLDSHSRRAAPRLSCAVHAVAGRRAPSGWPIAAIAAVFLIMNGTDTMCQAAHSIEFDSDAVCRYRFALTSF